MTEINVYFKVISNGNPTVSACTTVLMWSHKKRVVEGVPSKMRCHGISSAKLQILVSVHVCTQTHTGTFNVTLNAHKVRDTQPLAGKCTYDWREWNVLSALQNSGQLEPGPFFCVPVCAFMHVCVFACLLFSLCFRIFMYNKLNFIVFIYIFYKYFYLLF